MTIRILVNGAPGKMGQQTVKMISDLAGEFTLVGMTNKNNDLAMEIKKSQAEVVIDFTNADVVFKNAQIIIESRAHPVIGTSGLVKNQIQQLEKRCKELKLGGIIAPNFSLGAVLMMKYCAEIVKYFPYVEIIEMHHTGKLDSPSGTALRTAELLAEGRSVSPTFSKNTHETIPGARGANYEQIPIHAVRLPGVIANQQVVFGGLGETLTVRHDTLDRQSFMSGVILACQKVIGLDKLIYGLENLL
jgi:4-hydroxy-tetrahydrodipicolinate reductase